MYKSKANGTTKHCVHLLVQTFCVWVVRRQSLTYACQRTVLTSKDDIVTQGSSTGSSLEVLTMTLQKENERKSVFVQRFVCSVEVTLVEDVDGCMEFVISVISVSTVHDLFTKIFCARRVEVFPFKCGMSSSPFRPCPCVS